MAWLYQRHLFFSFNKNIILKAQLINSMRGGGDQCLETHLAMTMAYGKLWNIRRINSKKGQLKRCVGYV